MFIIYGNVQLIDGKYDAWQAAYDKLQEYVYANEPTTLTYYFGVPLEFKDDFSPSNQLIAFEAYGKREDLYETHFNSSGMAPFLQATPPTMATGFDLTHYTEDSGFLAKIPSPLNEDTASVIHDTKVLCTSSSAATTVLQRLRGIAEHAENNEEGTFTFLVLKSLDSENQVRIFERYENWEALAANQKNPAWADLLLGSKEEIKSLERRTYAPNKKGWLHRPQ